MSTAETAAPQVAHSAGPARGHGTGGPAPKRIVVGYGFWIFLLSDIIMFSAFFAAYAVLADATAGGPTGSQLFDLNRVALETALLLLSSFACGMASIGASIRNVAMFQIAMTATFVLGAGFLALELNEFAGLVAQGAGRSVPLFSRPFSAWWAAMDCISRWGCCGCSP